MWSIIWQIILGFVVIDPSVPSLHSHLLRVNGTEKRHFSVLRTSLFLVFDDAGIWLIRITKGRLFLSLFHLIY